MKTPLAAASPKDRDGQQSHSVVAQRVGFPAVKRKASPSWPGNLLHLRTGPGGTVFVGGAKVGCFRVRAVGGDVVLAEFICVAERS